MARTRTRSYGTVDGEFHMVSSPNIDSYRSDIIFRDVCTDGVGEHDLSFQVTHNSVVGGRANLIYYLNPAHTEWKECINYPLNYFSSASGSVSHQTDPARPSNSYLAVKLLAATNPSKPVVDLPVSLLELRELPQLLHTIGESLIKTYAKKHIQREFGLTPLMSDVVSIMKMSEQIARRVKLFKELREKPLCRKATLYTGSIITNPGNVVYSNSSPAYCTVQHRRDAKVTNRKVWGYVTWTPDAVFDKSNLAYADPAIEFLARRAVYGSQLGLVTLWNAIPWTWLIDWFGNVGDWLEANRHVVPAHPSLPRICETVTSIESYSVESSNIGLTKGSMPVTWTTTSKSRTLVSASLPSAYLPFLTQRQVGILASLAILRR